MARLWSSGFELNSTTAGVEYTFNGTATPSIQTTTVRSGTYALQINNLTSTVDKSAIIQFAAGTAPGPYYFRAYYKVATAPSAENIIMQIETAGGWTVWISIDSSRQLRLYDEDGVIGSASSALATDTWHRIEIEFDGSGSAGSHVARAKINGTEFAGSATRSFFNANCRYFIVGANLQEEAQTTGDWFFDDIAINNSTGSFQNSYPGEGEIIHLRPNAAGDNSGWTDPIGGGLYVQVDEVTPDDGTTYITETISGDIVDVNLDATPAALASDDTINVVQVGVRFRATNAFSSSPFVLRIKASSGGTVEEGSTITPASTTWMTNATAAPRNYSLALYDLPGASTTEWTKANLDATQIGARVTGSVSQIEVSTLWLLVDHKPAAAEPPATAVKDIIGMGIIPFPR